MHAGKFLSLFLVLAFTFTALAGSGQPAPDPVDPWIGAWAIDFSASSINGTDSFLLEGLAGTLALYPDGTFVLRMTHGQSAYDESEPGVYVVAGDTMATFMEPNLELYRFTIDGGHMTLTEATTGEVLALRRLPEPAATPPDARQASAGPWIGVWDIDFPASSVMDIDSLLLEDFTGAITFYPDGTFVHDLAVASIGYGESFSGNYLVADDIIATYMESEMDMDRFTIHGDTFTLTSMTTGDVLVLIRRQPD